jgi:hypothetical protein
MIKTLIVILLFSLPVFPQTKYLIYFKDKGISKPSVLNKSSAMYKAALSKLSPRSIERRKKIMGKNFITYEDIPLDVDYVQQMESMGIKVVNKLRWFDAVSAYLTSTQFAEVTNLPFVQKVRKVKTLKLNPDIEKLYNNSNSVQSLDSLYGFSYQEYNLSDIPAAFAKGIDGKGVVIGILDNGFRWKEHDALKNRNVVAEYNFVFHDTSTAPQPGDSPESGIHGTSVFSLIGGYEPGKIISPAYDASFILAKTEDDRSETHVEEDNYAAALQWMESLGADITTSSLGYNIFDDSTYSYSYSDMNGNTTIVTKAVNLAFQRGVLCFNAAGNEGNNSWKYVDAPADAFNVIAVGAVDLSNNRASFSSIGPTVDGRIKPDVVAMGESNYVADISDGENGFSYGSGTSYATPIASGIGAMLLSVYPEISNTQARNIILVSSENSQSPNNEIGYGLISAKNTLSFPVIDSTSNGYIINKIFFSNNGIDSNSVKIHYSNIVPEVYERMQYEGKLKFSSILSFYSYDSSQFYFTYNDNDGNEFRDPEGSLDYSLTRGKYIIGFQKHTGVQNSQNDNLEQNYPNPFVLEYDKYTNISYGVPAANNVKLLIYNSMGQEIKALVNGYKAPGYYIVEWDGTNSQGNTCASGVYFYILDIGGNKNTRKMIFLK